MRILMLHWVGNAFGLLGWVSAWAVLMSCASCTDTPDRFSVAQSGQGTVTLAREPRPSLVKRREEPPDAPVGPTRREIELQQTIDALEVRSRSLEEQAKELQAEIRRLKDEKERPSAIPR